jgi:hypothetical protein
VINLKVNFLTKNQYEEYERFIKQYKTSLFFHSIKYHLLLSELLQANIETLVATDNENTIKGVLCLLSKEGKFGKVYNSVPFYGSNGGVISDDPATTAKLLEKYNSLIKQDHVAASTFIENPLDIKDHSIIEHDLIDERICQFTKLDYDNCEESLMNSFHYKTRNMLRKSFKSGLTHDIDNNAMGFLYEIHKENMIAIGGKPKQKVFFDNINKFFKAGEDYNIYVAKLDGKPISALLLFYYNGFAEYYTPVIKAEFRELQPNSFLIYHSMVDASKKGHHTWNWGGTWKSQENLYRFKIRFGAYDKNYKYYIKINNAEIYHSNPKELAEHYDNFYLIPFDQLKVNNPAN